MRLFIALATTVMTLVGGPAAFAQTADGDAGADTLVVPLKEVVVTGTRTRESAEKAPAAISVIDKREFRDARGLSLGDALWRVPGVFVQSRAGGQDLRLTIRGFGARGAGGRSNSGALRGIRVLLDGVPLTEPDGRTSLDLADLGIVDRVEVSRSNASALYGNAAGGVVNLRTDLAFAEPYLEVRGQGGAWGLHREQLLAGYVRGGTRTILSAMNSRYDGWRANSRSETMQAFAKLAAPLGPRTQLGVTLSAVDNLNHFPGALTMAEFETDPSAADPTFELRQERRHNRLVRLATNVDQAFSGSHDLSVSAFIEPKRLERSQRGTFREFDRYHTGGAFTWQMRRAFGSGLRGGLSIGGDEAWQDGSINFWSLTTPGGTRGTTLRDDKREGANSAGGFAQGELTWNERWSLKSATRFDHQVYISEDHLNPALDATKTFRRWTPKASIAYTGDAHTIFASLGGGVEVPAFNEINPPPGLDTLTSFNPFLEPMHSTTYEVGARGQLPAGVLPGRMRYDAALYWIDVMNDLVPYNGGSYFFTAGHSRRRGAELGLGWSPVERLRLNGSVTASQNEYVAFVDEFGNDRSGNEQPGISPLFFAGSARYAWMNGIAAEVTLESSDGYYADDANTARTRPFTNVGATLSYTRGLGSGVIRAFVMGDNLGDAKYMGSVFINGTGGRFFEPGLPRNVAAGVSYRWR